MAANCSTGVASVQFLNTNSGRRRWSPQPYRARRALRFSKRSFLPMFVPASFCASVGAAIGGPRAVLLPSNASKLSRIAVTTLAMTLLLTIKADIEFSFQERHCSYASASTDFYRQRRGLD